MLASVLPTAASSPPSIHKKFVTFLSVIFKFLFDDGKHTMTSYSVARLLGVFLLQEVDYLPCSLLFQSPVPVKIYSKHPNFLLNKEYDQSKKKM